MLTLAQYETATTGPYFRHLRIGAISPADAPRYAEPIARLEATMQALAIDRKVVVPPVVNSYGRYAIARRISYTGEDSEHHMLVAELTTSDGRVSYVAGHVGFSLHDYAIPEKTFISIDTLAIDPVLGTNAAIIGSILVGTAIGEYDTGAMGIDMTIRERLIARDVAANAHMAMSDSSPATDRLYFHAESAKDAHIHLQTCYPPDLTPILQ